jgi:hypothetical protein
MIGSPQLKYLDRNTERGYTDKESVISLSVILVALLSVVAEELGEQLAIDFVVALCWPPSTDLNQTSADS